MVRAGSRELIRLFPTVFKGTHIALDEVTTERARTIHVESPGSTPTPTATTSVLPVEISAVPGRCRSSCP